MLEFGAFSSRFAEKPTGINVASKSSVRNSAKIVNTSRVRAVIKTRRSGPTPIRITARRRRTILRSLIPLNNSAG